MSEGMDRESHLVGRSYLYRRVKLCSCLLAIILTMGCGPDIDLATCIGTVQREGNAVTNGKVLLVPVLEGHRAVALIQEDGTFELAVVNIGEGVPPGQYRVSVITNIEYEGSTRQAAYDCPKDFTINVEASKDNELNIHVQESEGWTVSIDDE